MHLLAFALVAQLIYLETETFKSHLVTTQVPSL